MDTSRVWSSATRCWDAETTVKRESIVDGRGGEGWMAHVGFRDEGLGAWGARCDGVGDGMQGSGFGLGMMGCEEGEEEDGLAEEEEDWECGPGGGCEREGVHDWCDLGMGCRLTFFGSSFGPGVWFGKSMAVGFHICALSGVFARPTTRIRSLAWTTAQQSERLPHGNPFVLDLFCKPSLLTTMTEAGSDRLTKPNRFLTSGLRYSVQIPYPPPGHENRINIAVG